MATYTLALLQCTCVFLPPATASREPGLGPSRALPSQRGHSLPVQVQGRRLAVVHQGPGCLTCAALL
jgi:hypothetical protein